MRVVAGPIVDARSAAPCESAPALGADTDTVLRDCGFSPAEITALRKDRVI